MTVSDYLIQRLSAWGVMNMVTWEERALAGDPKFEATQDLPDFPYANYAKSLGLDGIRVDDPDALVRRGFARSRPTARSCSKP